MLQIKTYSGFTKRDNSTKRPTGGTVHTVELKDETSIKNPTFILGTLDFTINYVEAFGNYYYCDVVNLDSHRSELVCRMDRPATFKGQIGAYTGYIEYASAAPAGLIYLDDPRNFPTTLVSSNSAKTSVGWTKSASGSYLIGMANAISNGHCGAPAYYLTNAAGLSSITAKIFDQTIISVIENQFNGVYNSIVSCIWLPFDGTWLANVMGAAAIPVYAGSEDLGLGNYAMLTNRTWHNKIYCTIPNGLNYAGTYIQSNKYYNLSVYLPGVGVCRLDYDLFKLNQTGITIDVYMDVITGDVVYYLSTASPMSSGEYVTFSGNIAAKVPIVGASYDGIGVASGILSTASSAASMNPVATAQGVLNIASSLSLDTMVVGANSSPLSLMHESDVVVYTHIRNPRHGATEAELEVFRSEHGMPFFNTAQISSMPGFIQCRNASVSIPGDGEEQAAINAMMNSGFYYE